MSRNGTSPDDVYDVPRDRERWQQLTGLVALFTGTARLVDGHPESLIIVGSPASGKTTLLNRFSLPSGDFGNDHLHFVSSGTSYGLYRILVEKVPKGTTHMVATEMQTLVMRKGALWDAWQGTMLQAMEEGMTEIADGRSRFPFRHKPKLGLIAAMTTRAYLNLAPEIQDTGFLSRVMVVSWDRMKGDMLAARYAVSTGDDTELRKVYCDWPTRIEVRISPRVGRLVDRYAADLSPDDAHRSARRFTNLVRVLAYCTGDTEVKERHLTAFRRFEWAWRSVD